MGQYWIGTITNKGGTKTDVYKNYVDGEYQMAKLMEMSWWENPYVTSIAKMVYKNPGRVAWVGDYANDLNSWELPGRSEKHMMDFGYPNWYKDIYSTTYDVDRKEIEKPEFFNVFPGVLKNVVNLSGKYLCNHDEKEYIELDQYYESSVNNSGYAVNPVSLLTAIGNGLGGGDYRGEGRDDVGSWALDLISIEDEEPQGYWKSYAYFKEEW